MKKLFSLVALCASLGFFAGCGCCKKSSKKPVKKEMKHKEAKHKDMKHKGAKHKDMGKKSAPKKGYVQRIENEVEHVWDEVTGARK